MLRHFIQKGIAITSRIASRATRSVSNRRVVGMLLLLATMMPMFFVFMPVVKAASPLFTQAPQQPCTRSYVPGIGVICTQTGRPPAPVGTAVGELGDDKPVNCLEITAGVVPTGFLSDPFYCTLSAVLNGVKWLGGALLEWSATLLDYTLKISVFNNIIDQFYQGLVIGWTVIRDFANLAFIFVLVYIGVQTMLDIGSSGKQLLAKVIIVALLVNFSFFMTRFVIDISNIFAYAIYSSIAPPDGNGDSDLGGVIRDLLEIPSQMQQIDVGTMAGDGNLKWRPLLILTVQIVFIFIAVWVFFQAALLIFVRIIAFTFLIVISPAAFVAYILPGTRKYFNEWLELLTHQALVAPIFLFLLFVVIKIMSASNSLPYSPNATNQFLFSFILNAGLLIAALKITKRYAGEFGSKATNIGNAVAGFALGAATGGVAFAGRQSIGRLGLAVAKSEALAEAEAQGGARGFAARQAQRLGAATSRANFDARNTKVVSSNARKIGLDLGKGSQSNYASIRDKSDKYYQSRIDHVSKTRVTASDMNEANERIENAETVLRGMAPTDPGYAKQKELVDKMQADPHAIASQISMNRGKYRGQDMAQRMRAISAPIQAASRTPLASDYTPGGQVLYKNQQQAKVDAAQRALTAAEAGTDEAAKAKARAAHAEATARMTRINGMNQNDLAQEIADSRAVAADRITVPQITKDRYLEKQEAKLKALNLELAKEEASPVKNENILARAKLAVSEQEKHITEIKGMEANDPKLVKAVGLDDRYSGPAMRLIGWSGDSYNASTAAIRKQGKTSKDRLIDVLKEVQAEDAPVTPPSSAGGGGATPGATTH